MDVSIIIVNYNTQQLILDCIQSIYNQHINSTYEIIVVDNNSSDGSCHAIKEHFPQVVLVQSPDNIGFGRANNLGIEYASGEFYFFLNSDTVLLNNAIDYFVDFYRNHKNINIGALGGILLNQKLQNCHSYGAFINKGLLIKDIFNKYIKIFGNLNKSLDTFLYPGDLREDYIQVDYITGADMFVPRKVVEHIGAFDPIFFMYCEEVDWQKRMELHKYERLIIPGPRIIHLEGASAPSKSKHRSLGRVYNIFKSQIIYIHKYSTPIEYILFRIVFALLWIPAILFRPDSFKAKLKVVKLLIAPI